MPRISVIMGVYNGAKRMDEAIKSIIKQTFTDWEFIICDDGSIDNTYQKLLEWSKIDKRIFPIRNEVNRGLAATLNHCITYAKGEYIARMDDDDYSYPHRFEKQVNFLDNNKEYAFCSSIVLVYDGVKTYAPYKNYKEKPEAKDFLFNSCFIHPATIFRAEELRKAGCYRVAKETSRMEDYDLFMRMYAMGMKGYNIQEPLLRYFINMDAMKNKHKYRYRIDELIVRYKGFKQLGLLPKGLPYVIKPLLVGLIPKKILLMLREYNNKLIENKLEGNGNI